MTADAAPLPELGWGPIFDSHPLAHFVYDTETLALLQVNEAALVRYACSREEFLSLRRTDLLLPGEPEALRSFVAGLPASARVEPQRVWLERTRDGRVLHADVRGMAVLFRGRPARLVAVVDAGSRARLQADADQAREMLEAAGRLARVGGWSLHLGSGAVRWSDEVCRIHGREPGTVLHRAALLEHYAAACRDRLDSALRSCAEGGATFDLELALAGDDVGPPRWVRMVGAPVRDGQGRVQALEGAAQDITERKHDALALAESRTRLAALLGAIPDLWFVIDAEMRYVEVSDPAHPALNRPWAEKHGQPLEVTVDAALARTARDAIVRSHAGGRPERYVYDMAVLGGSVRSFEGRCVPLPEGRTLMLIRDITEEAQLEQRFRAMADAAPIGIFMTDTHADCTYTNPTWQRLYGLDERASLGKAWMRVVHPDDLPGLRRTLREAAGAAARAEFRLRLPNGVERAVEAHTGPILRADGSIAGHVGSVVDVTHARELQAERQARAVAEEAGRRQSAFMSRVSHELRTPLNAILGFGQLLQDEQVSPDARARVYAGHVVHAGRHMLTLVDDLLELQRLEHAPPAFKPASVDIASLLRGCAELLGPAAVQAGARLEVSAPEGLVVHSEERCLRQVLLNLGSNALKYGGAAAARPVVVLRAERREDAVLLHVVDDGPGLRPDQLARLFRPFERLEQEAGSQPGSGLGLVITRQLAQLLGGEVTLESVPGRGTTATLRLPA